jgi:hypothetical protein
MVVAARLLNAVARSSLVPLLCTSSCMMPLPRRLLLCASPPARSLNDVASSSLVLLLFTSSCSTPPPRRPLIRASPPARCPSLASSPPPRLPPPRTPSAPCHPLDPELQPPDLSSQSRRRHPPHSHVTQGAYGGLKQTLHGRPRCHIRRTHGVPDTQVCGSL